MDRDREPLSRVLVAGLLAFFLAIGLTALQGGAAKRGTISAPESLARTLVSPVQNASRGLLDGSGVFFAGLFGASRLKRENAALRDQLARLSLYDESSRRLEAEIDHLRRLQGLRDLPGRKWITADVRGFAPRESRISIAAGKQQGVKVGCPIVTPDGLLALVSAVTANECYAILLTSASTTIGGIVAGHDPPPAGLLRGENGATMSLTLDSPNASVANGDRVETTGFGALVPRGLTIGRVIQVDDNPELGARTAKVYPAATLGRVREVRILL